MPEFLKRKRALANRYFEAFEKVRGVRVFREPSFSESNYWLNALVLESDDFALRDELLKQAHAAGLLMRPAWVLMHRLSMYASCPRMDLSVAESLERRLINLPSSARLGGALA